MVEPLSPEAKRLVAAGCEPRRVKADGPANPNAGAADWGLGPAWRRGVMHAVERIDLILSRKPRPATAIELIREALDELTELQRAHMPGSYAEAFAICDADLKRVRRHPGEAA